MLTRSLWIFCLGGVVGDVCLCFFSSFSVCDSEFPLLPTGVSLSGVFSVVFDSAYSPVYSFVLLAGLVMSGQLVQLTFSVAMSPRGVFGVFGSEYSLPRSLLLCGLLWFLGEAVACCFEEVPGFVVVEYLAAAAAESVYQIAPIKRPVSWRSKGARRGARAGSP